MRTNQFLLTALAVSLLAIPASAADAPKGYLAVPGTDTAIQLYGNACFDIVNDGVQGGGVMQGLSGASTMTDDAGPKNQWDMTIDESRFGMRTITPSDMGDIKTRFEMDFLGTNKDSESKGAAPWAHPISGETKNYAHVRQMYGEWNGWLIGKADNNFEDPDGSPNYIDWDGLLADWYGCGRDMQIRYTTSFNPKTTLSVAIERNDSNTIGGTNPTTYSSTGASHSLPGDLTARLTYADKWGHIAFAGAYTKYEQFGTTPYTAASGTTPAKAGGTATFSENAFSWALSGHFQFGDDSLVYHGGIGNGQWGAGLEDGVAFANDGSLQVVQAKQFEIGYEHFFTPKTHANVFGSYVGYSQNTNENMDGAAFKSYVQYGANVMYNATKTMQYAVEFIYGTATTFQSGALVNPDGSTTSAVHESKLHFQAKYKFN